MSDERPKLCEVFYLSFADYCIPFGLPDYPKVARVVKDHFRKDALNCDYKTYNGDDIYRIELPEPVEAEQYLTFEINNETYDIKLEPEDEKKERERSRRNIRRQEGLLLTFKDAGKNFLRDVRCSKFDEALQNDLKLEVLKPTEYQKIPETEIYNGNRYAVVRRPENMSQISETLPIVDPSTKKTYLLRIGYRGKSWFCSRCREKHTEQCPELAAFYKAKDERKKLEERGEIRTKIMSDSTLRNASTIGLRADVLCMSGGGIGQVAQAAMDDPDTVNKDIVIIAGANDVKNGSYKSNKEFAESVNMGLEKIVEIATTRPEQQLIIPKMHPDGNKEDSNKSIFINS